MQNDFYLHCDKLDNLPALNRENWLLELELQCNMLPEGASLLQIGCMDGTRIVEILNKRRDLKVTGLEIEKDFVALAEKNLKNVGLRAKLICADITTFETSNRYDFVTCLNNTLSYIPETAKAVEHMRKAADVTIISVYAEQFDEAKAEAYFQALHTTVTSSDKNFFHVKGFGAARRFTRADVESWGGEITETPLGYLSVIR